MFEVTSTWKSTYPEAHAGLLVMRAGKLFHIAVVEKTFINNNRKFLWSPLLKDPVTGKREKAVALHGYKEEVITYLQDNAGKIYGPQIVNVS